MTLNNFEGKNLGPYRILNQIGRGGMASIYKAYQPGVNRYVAIKVLAPHLVDDPQFNQRFQREARAISQLEHPHIIPIHDYGQEADISYIVLRFVESGSLKEKISAERLSLSETARIISEIANALDYAHRAGIVHRDIKPANILLDKEGNSYLTDFGLARILESSLQISATGISVGTPAYMAPEQGQGLTPDPRADIYSLGVVLYEMVTGQVPFSADTPLAVLMKHMNDPLPPPQTINPDIPEGVECIILKALSKEPADRFQKASDLAQALEAAVLKIPSPNKKGLDLPPPTPRKAAEPISIISKTQQAWRTTRGRILLLLFAVTVLAGLGLIASRLNRLSIGIASTTAETDSGSEIPETEVTISTQEIIKPAPSIPNSTTNPVLEAAVVSPTSPRMTATAIISLQPVATATPLSATPSTTDSGLTSPTQEAVSLAFEPLSRPSCRPGETELYFEDFEDGDTDGWRFLAAHDGRWIQATASEWYLEQAAGNTFLVANRITGGAVRDFPITSSNSAIQVDFRIIDLETPDFEVVWSPYKGLPRALVREYWPQEEPEFSMTWRTAPYTVDNLWHTLRLSVAGDQIILHVDGQRVAQFTDPNPLSLVAGSIANFGGITQIDNVLVCDLSGADFSTTAVSYYVSSVAVDGGEGSQAAPWHSIQEAIDNITTSGTIYLANGTYFENLTTHGKDITILGGYDPQTWEQTGLPDETVIDGGGQDHVLFIDTAAFVEIENLTITNGFADCGTGHGGGGVHVSGEGTQVTIRNSIIRENSSVLCGGGGVEVDQASLILQNSWVVDNQAPFGGGINMINRGHLVLFQATLANNQPDGLYLENTSITLEAFNSILTEPITNIPTQRATHIFTEDPLFVDPLNGDYHLRYDSPAIDAGLTHGSPLVDIDGKTRPEGIAVDIGADEFHPQP